MDVEDPSRTKSNITEEEIVRKYLRGFKDEIQSWSGYVQSEKEAAEMERELLTVGISFKTADSHERLREGSSDEKGKYFGSPLPVS